MKFFPRFRSNQVSRFVFDKLEMAQAPDFEGGDTPPPTTEVGAELDGVSAERVELLNQLTASPEEMQKVGLLYTEEKGWHIDEAALDSLRGSMIDLVGRATNTVEIRNLQLTLEEANTKQKDSIAQRALLQGVYEVLLDDYMEKTGFTPDGNIVLGHEFQTPNQAVKVKYTETGKVYRFAKRVKVREVKVVRIKVVYQEFEIGNDMTEAEKEKVYQDMAQVAVPRVSLGGGSYEDRVAEFIRQIKGFEPQQPVLELGDQVTMPRHRRFPLGYDLVPTPDVPANPGKTPPGGGDGGPLPPPPTTPPPPSPKTPPPSPGPNLPPTFGFPMYQYPVDTNYYPPQYRTP